MQFCKGGPDVPDRLIQAHEDGRVVFFCGAGISYPAGLPGFKGLVKKLCETLNPEHDPELQRAIKTRRYDTAIGILEDRIVGGRDKVRSTLARFLDVQTDANKDTHAALLTLSHNFKEGQTRVVTTNFDRLFEDAIATCRLDVHKFQAPALPVPKAQWDGIVYLHGLLPKDKSKGSLNDLVISSGDFGLAYLKEGWAARFVTELFRNYHICFVGYSLDDPILRYMTDALAADKALGESPLEMFAFGSFSKGKECSRSREWHAKGVTPILYKEFQRHRYLHGTLDEWAKICRDGVEGKKAILNRDAQFDPAQSTKNDNFSGRVLWALTDPTGEPARHLAKMEPAPSLKWLDFIAEDHFDNSDLTRFNISSQKRSNENLKFSLICRPLPHDLSPSMALTIHRSFWGHWDDRMRGIALWLTQHLDNPKLLLWVAMQGKILYPEFANLIERELTKSNIRPAMRTLWKLLLVGYMKNSFIFFNLFQWIEHFNKEGLTASLRLQLRRALYPRVSMRQKILIKNSVDCNSQDQSIDDLIDWEIILVSEFAHSLFDEWRCADGWIGALPELLDDFNSLLSDTMDLMRELGGAGDTYDKSYFQQPSIENHPQNRRFRDWTVLIELTRDAWLETAKAVPKRALRVAEEWRRRRYPLFRRLCLFAATQEEVVPTQQAVSWLLDDGHRWLWSNETRREAIRLIAALAPRLESIEMETLEQAIDRGPPRTMYRDDIDGAEWSAIRDQEVWFRLAKIAAADGLLSANMRRRLEYLSANYPDWQLASDESDEFPFWMSEGSLSVLPPSPPGGRELVEWLKQHREKDSWREDDWARRCREHFRVAAWALCVLARDDVWPADRWREALYAWSDGDLGSRSWCCMAPMLAAVSDDRLQSICRGLSHWLLAIASKVESHESLFLRLCERVLKLEAEDDGDGDADSPLTAAINHPVGVVVEALLDWWFKQQPVDWQGLPEEIEPLFTHVCTTPNAAQRHGRVILASRGIALFRVDRSWTETHLLPYFDWQRCEAEARAAWEGFCWSPRLYPSLIEALGGAFLETARRHAEWGQHTKTTYPALLTYAALEGGDLFKEADLKEATRILPDNALVKVARTLRGALEGAGDRRNEYWKNRARPYLQKIWPQSRERRTFAISEALGRVCIAAGDSFPKAMETLRDWLQPLCYPDRLAGDLLHAGLCQQFPGEALDFLNSIFREGLEVGSQYLTNCLEKISAADANLEDDSKFRRLRDLARSHSA